MEQGVVIEITTCIYEKGDKSDNKVNYYSDLTNRFI